MKKNTGNAAAIILLIIGVVLVGIWMFSSRNPIDEASTSTAPTSIAESKAIINGKTISLIVVDTEETREVGLGGRDGLADNQAMLFIFDKPDFYEFWMKDMKFPIDIIWLGTDRKIVHIENNVSPETYPDTTFMPESEALYVLETPAGFAEKNNIKIGDVVELNLKK
jgi:uncharacterized protein